MSLQDFIRTSGDDIQSVAMIADLDEAGGYYGYVSLKGAWVIKKMTATSMRYVFGSGDYQTNWTNRASLTFTLPNGEA